MMIRTSRGFTLAEVIATVVLIGIVAALAVPRLERAVTLWRTRGAANQLAGDLARVRAAAVREGHPVTLVIEASALCPAPTPGVAGTRYVIQVGETPRILSSRDLRGGRDPLCVASNRSERIVFNSRGLLHPPGNRTLVVSSGLAVADTLTLSVVGRVLRRF
jgi:prepilin-type N-terminal cleavage/methylation domain-containing protein